MKDYSALFTPVKIGNVEIKNRYAMAPMVVTHDFDEGAYNHKSIEYHMERARGGVGLIFTGAAKVETEIEAIKLAVAGPRTNPPLFIERMKIFTDELANYETKLFPQITVGAGRSMFPQFGVEGHLIAPSFISNRWDPSMMHRGLTVDEIKKLVDIMAEGAKICKDGGAHGIGIHALHEGYLLDSFAMSFFNKRSDQYGGSLENRLRFAKEIREAIADKCGSDFPVVMRFSLKSYIKDIRIGGLPGEEFQEQGRDIEEGLEVAQLLEKYGYDALDVDAGTYDSWYWAHPPYFHEEGLYLPLSEAVRKVVKIPVICAGMMADPDLALDALNSGKLDMVALGRPLITDAEIVNKINKGNLKQIRPCLYCHEGCFNYNTVRATNCTVNARAGHEVDKPIYEKTSNPLNVVVVGAGPAGMESARLLAEKGHKVDVYDKADKVGGLFHAATAFDFKSHAGQLIDWWKLQLETLGVNLNLNTTVVEDSPFLKDADVIINATGGKEKMPTMKGIDGENVFTARNVCENSPKLGDKVAIIGAGLVGCELAIQLAKNGKRVMLVEMESQVIPERKAPKANIQMILELLDFYKVKQVTDAKAVEIMPDNLVVEQDGKAINLDVSSVVIAMGYSPDNELYEKMLPKYRAVLNVGDSFMATDVLDGVARAYDICKHI